MEGWKRLGILFGSVAWIAACATLGGYLSPGTRDWPVGGCAALGGVLGVVGPFVLFAGGCALSAASGWVRAGFAQDAIASQIHETHAGQLSPPEQKHGALSKIE